MNENAIFESVHFGHTEHLLFFNVKSRLNVPMSVLNMFTEF